MPLSLRMQRGASLIEALIALLIFTVGLLGLAAMQLNALQSTTDSGQRSQASWLMNDMAERMRSNPNGTIDDYQVAPNCAALPAVICADYYNPQANTKVNAANCNAAQMAAFDRWEAQCSYASVATVNPNGNNRFNSRDFLIVPDGGALTMDDASLSINWFSKAGSGKPAFFDGAAGGSDEDGEPPASAADRSMQSAAVEIVR